MTAMFSFTPGTTPLVLSVPHVGTYVPPDLLARMTAEAACVPDTDWHVERLYDFAYGLGASVIAATHSRLVVDLNRDPSGQALYPGASNTELCPLGTFADEPVYRAGEAPDTAEITTRVARYWRPYHEKLAAELARVRAKHGIAILWDAHSIVSRAPRFFAGALPDFNLGTADGASCDGGLAARIEARQLGQAARCASSAASAGAPSRASWMAARAAAQSGVGWFMFPSVERGVG